MRSYPLLAEFWTHALYFDMGFIGSFDGGLLFKRNNIHIWPFWLANVNLPPEVRYSQNELMLGALWIGRSHPPMNGFMSFVAADDFALRANSLTVQTPLGIKPARARLLAVAADLPARVRWTDKTLSL